jgi:hypothetical protein
MTELDPELLATVDALAPDEKRALFQRLRASQSLHPLEDEWSTSAESILEAILRAPDITQRGVRGILAEAVFCTQVLPAAIPSGWRDTTPLQGDHPFDAQISRDGTDLRIQVKLQRKRKGQPMLGRNATRGLGFSDECFVVETQRTRGGEKNGEKTRPYRFEEFDILAVSLSPSTRNWHAFRYTVASWLIPSASSAANINTFQPVPFVPNSDWTDSFATVVGWWESKIVKTITPRQ